MASLSPLRATDATYADHLGTEFVTIFVGPGRKMYAVHKELLISQSEYFDKALNGGFKEAEDNSIHLEEDDPDAIALLIGWLYRGVIPGPAPQSIPIQGAFPPSTTEINLLAGGTSVIVLPHSEFDSSRAFGNTELSLFQSILAHPRYSGYSSEELRLSDYKEGRRYVAEDPDSQAAFQQLAPHGLFGSITPGGIPLLPGSHFGPASTTTQPAGGFAAFAAFGSFASIGGGLGATSRLAQGASLFGNRPPTGSSLLGPSVVSSSGGGFASLSLGTGTQTSPPTSGLFGTPPATTTTYTTRTGVVFGDGQAQIGAQDVSSSGLFGNSHSAPSALLPASGTQAEQTATPQALSGPPPNDLFRSSTGTVGGGLFRPSEQTVQVLPLSSNTPQQSGGSLFTPPYQSSPGVFGYGTLSSADTGQPAVVPTSPLHISELGRNAHSLGGICIQSGPTSSSSQIPVSSDAESLSDAVNSALNMREDGHKGAAQVHISSQSSAPSTPSDTSFQDPVSGGDAISSHAHDTSTAQDLVSAPPSYSSQATPSNVTAGSSSNTRESTSVLPPTRPTSISSPEGSQVFGQLALSTVLPPTATTQNPPQVGATHPFDPLPARPATLEWPTPAPHAFASRKFSEITSQNPFNTTTSSHQLALLNLALFAETICWPGLYNASMTSYMAGERSLSRPPPLEHINLIYDRTHDESTLRQWAVDNIAAFKGEVDMSGYMGLLVEHEGFLEGVLKKLRESGQLSSDQDGGFNGAGELKYRMLESGKKDLFGKGKGKSVF